MSDTDNLVVPSPEGAVVGTLMLVIADPEGCLKRAQKLQAAADAERGQREAFAKDRADAAVEDARRQQAADAKHAKQLAELESVRRENQNILAAAEAFNREGAALRQRADQVMHAAENRIADMTQRFAHGGAK
jgi:hypothetical protein